MKYVFVVLLFLHGAIHLLGFVKAYKIAGIDQITQDVSRGSGTLWLVTAALFLICALLRIVGVNGWWMVSAVAVVLSQILIFNYWKDARFGTIANLLILLPTVVAGATFLFQRKVDGERTKMLTSIAQTGDPMSDNALTDLPYPVEKWVQNSGINKLGKVSSVWLSQDIEMKMKPEQENWQRASATQLFTLDPPAFNWMVKLDEGGLMPILGRDYYGNGKSEMLIKMFGLIPVVNVRENDKLDEGAIQRYLAEITWFPSAALSKYIHWEPIDSLSARATIKHNGTIGSGIFHFDENGNFLSFETMRYYDVTGDAQTIKWTVTAYEYGEFNGVKVPVYLKAEWALDSGPWTWLQMTVREIKYNVNPDASLQNKESIY